MKIAPALLALPLLILLLTWLSLGAANSDAERFDKALNEMDRFSMLEAALHRDVLSARAGMLHNYDPLVRELSALQVSIGRLRQDTAAGPATKTAIDRLDISVSHQEELVEQFKSNNALLRNSLTSFALLSSSLNTSGQGESAAQAANSLVSAVLRLSLDTSEDVANEVRDRLDALAETQANPRDTESVVALLAHGRLLLDLLPATDSLLKRFLMMPQPNGVRTLRADILSQQSASRDKARNFRSVLYLTSLLLVALLAYLGWQLQARAQALRRRAHFEHTVAGISMNFVGASFQTIDAIVEQALADIARCFRADRAYLVLSGLSPQSYAWCSQHIPFPAGWPDQAPSLMQRFGLPSNGIIHVPRVSRLQPGEYRDCLAAAGLQGWACAGRRGADGGEILLGLDAVTHPRRIIPVEDVGLLHMALDTIANGLGRKFLEAERTRLETRLQQARRLETVGALASGIAHNFNNIVGAILGYTEMAAEENLAHNRDLSIINEIRRAGERARELVDQILTFSRRRDARHSPVNVQALIAEAASLLRASLPATIELSVHKGMEPVTVPGVATQLQQVILNLCNNAAQAVDHVGRIGLEVKTDDLATTTTLSHGSLPPGRYVRIAVSDAGQGIQDSILGRIFEPFFTTRVAGNGLGLATSWEIVNEHGGCIDVKSEIGNGSRFEVWLPRLAAAVPVPLQPVPSLPLGCGETVLVVEDEREQLLKDEEILAALGYEPIGVTGATNAKTVVQSSPERFDLVLIGQLSQTTAAPELATALHDIAPATPILLATGSADQFATDSLIAAGISDVVPWPMIAAEIATSMADCLLRKHTSATPRSSSAQAARAGSLSTKSESSTPTSA